MQSKPFGEHYPFSCFVTGTDTEIGKTLTSAAILNAWAAQGYRVVGMKPVAAGAHWRDEAWRNEDTDSLVQAGNVEVPYEWQTPYLWREPMAPHLAARQAGGEMRLEVILDAYERLSEQAQAVVVEGVGGFRVPLTEQLDTADLAVALGLPVILVVGIKLGCISHALLTVEAIRSRGLFLAGWVANQVEIDMLAPQANVQSLCERIPAPFLGHVPRLEQPRAEQAATFLSWPQTPDR
ncbi:dethiobiotin synthase [Pusillimonas sp. CC-YST705]|uniref:ATP-dependent dethiobiotin synthetase BioD n=1 Tax=Mesopusillimonas faecipullorum TaxID=2755040 RepID=A0ABS8CEH5_9BURK|nr:dethiobiotin synthase [Mesopusillimonas faecipullorum]MCB5364445.1 dethiobiotin synthase [Mesopusillimonas faecipullorum]